MIGLLLTVLIGAGVIQFIKKYILRIKDPTVEMMWMQLENQNWYQQLVSDDKMLRLIEKHKKNGLLSDPYYVKRIIEHKGTRDGFIEFIEKN